MIHADTLISVNLQRSIQVNEKNPKYLNSRNSKWYIKVLAMMLFCLFALIGLLFIDYFLWETLELLLSGIQLNFLLVFLLA